MRPDGVTHLFSVDVEEYFQVSVFDGLVPRSDWTSLESRVEPSVDRLLDLLGEHDVVGTFFVLGWIARRHQRLVRRIADRGHELASHGWSHRRVSDLSRKEFRAEIRSTKDLLEEIGQRPVLGYRAPSFSITRGTEWAFDELIETGYRYDSSLFPIRRRGYGYSGCRPVPHMLDREGGQLLELPPATTVLGGVRLPAAGGAYLRLLPFQLTRRAFRQATRRGQPAMFYTHPWELDPDQPVLPASRSARIRHYGGLERTLPRLHALLNEFPFSSVERVFDLAEQPSAPTVTAVRARA